MAIPGGVQNNPQVSSRIAAQNQATKAEVKEVAKEMKSMMADMKDVQEQMNTQTAKRTTTRQKSEDGNIQQNKALDQLKEQNQVQQKQVNQQANSQQAELGKGKDAEVVASAMAGIMAEEELDEKSELQKTLEEKMEILVEYAGKLEDVELENPDNNYELQKMFKNAKEFEELKGKDQKLSKQIEDLEINLERQEATDKLNEIASKDSIKKMRDEIVMRHSKAEKENDEKSDQSKQNKDEHENNEEDENNDD